MDEEEEGSRPPAPGALALVQAFVNTVDFEPGLENLGSPEQLRAWLAERGLLGSDEPVSAADLSRAVEVREALRALLEANNGAPLDETAVATLNQAGRAACLQVRFDGDGHAQLEPSTPGVDGALGRILSLVYTAVTDGTWVRLKVCRGETCRWAFYDHSKNHSGAWCSMAVCGSRSKARAYRERRRGAVGVA